jgi:hypothetical protein
MKKFLLQIHFIIALVFNSNILTAQCSTNLLNNPGFDAPILSNIGNNLTGSITFNGGWTMTGGTFNVVRTNGSNYNGGPNNAQNGTQYVDITNGGGTVYQDFTISSASTNVSFGGYFSSREPGGYQNWTASINILSLPSLTVVATSNTRAFTNADATPAAQEVWHYINGNTTLSAGNYRYRVNLGNYGNFDGAFVFQNCSLPITLEYFGGNYSNNEVTLNWKYESQTNFSHFVVEKSLDGIVFNKVQNLYLTNSQYYNYKDIDLNTASTFFYRLKLVDNNGTYSYSNIIKIHTGPVLSFSILGNPAKDKLNITGLKRGAILKFIDNTGKMLFQRNIQDQSLSMDISFLSSGIYYLQYSVNGFIENKKLIKL